MIFSGKCLPPPIRPAGVLAVLFILLAALSCGRSEPPSAPAEKVRIGVVRNFYGVTVGVAHRRGFFEREGVAVEPIYHPAGRYVLEAMRKGECEFGVTAETPIVISLLEGDKIEMLACLETIPGRIGIVARKDPGVRTPADLRGKKVALVVRSNVDYLFGLILMKYGVPDDSVERVDLASGAAMDNLLLGGKVAAVCTSEPALGRIRKMLGADAVSFASEELYLVRAVLSTRAGFAAMRPETVRKVLRALKKAAQFIQDSPGEARNDAAAFFKVDPASIEEMMKKGSFEATLNQSFLLQLEDQANWAVDRAIVPPCPLPDFRRFIEARPLTDVDPGAVTLIGTGRKRL